VTYCLKGVEFIGVGENNNSTPANTFLEHVMGATKMGTLNYFLWDQSAV